MKILLSDYDGTFNHDSEAQELRNIAAVKAWRNKGNRFAVITGRGYYSAYDFFVGRGIAADYFICSNGAMILDGNGQILHTDYLPKAGVLPVCDYSEKSSAVFFILMTDSKAFDDNFYAKLSPTSWLNDDFASPYTPECLDSRKAVQINVEFGNVEQARAFSVFLTENVPGINAIHNRTCIDVVKAGVDKAKGAENLLSLLSLSEHDLICVGEGENDIAMIQRFGGYTLDNGVPEIKQCAKKIYKNVEELILDNM